MDSTVVMIGPSPDARGGIAAVVNVYRQAGLFDRWNVSYISTYGEASIIAKVKAAALGIANYFLLLCRGRVGLVHVHSASRWSFLRKSLFVLPALALRKPVIFQLHGGEFIAVYDKLNPVSRAYVRFVVEHCTRVVVLSKTWKEVLQEIAPRAAISVIMNPINAATSCGPGARRRADVLLFLGRLETQKGLYVLLDAVSRIDAGRRVRLLLGGEGDVQRVVDTANELGIAHRVEILGWVDGARKSELLDTATALVLPSFAEGLPMSVLEAMAHGAAVITTPVGGIPDVVDDGVDGILVPPDHPDKLADAIDYLLANPDIARKMGEEGRKKIAARFSAGVIVPQVEVLYRELGMDQGH